MPDLDRNNPLTLARFEVKRFRGPLPRLALAFILLIPMLYGCIYLAGNWDPYGRLDNVPVAIVNHDEPTTFNGKDIHAGQDFVDSLHDAGTFKFTDTTEQEAADGLARGDYYLVITVPKSFSVDLTSGDSDNPQRAQIMLRRNDANGFVIGTITNSAQTSIAKAIDETAVKSYFEAVFANLATIRESLVEAADGAQQLDDGLATAHDGSTKLADGAKDAVTGADKLNTGAAQLATGASTAADGASTLTSGLSDLNDGASQLADGSKQVADGTQTLADTLDPVLTLAADRLPDIQDAVNDAVDAAADLSSTVATGSSSVAGVSGDISDAVDQLGADNPDISSDSNYKELKRLADTLAKRADTAAGHATTIADAVNDADKALDNAGDLSSKATEAQSKIDQLNDGAQQVADGASDLSTGASQAYSGAKTLSSGLGDLDDGAQELATGTDTLTDGLHTLSDGATSLDDGISQLADGADTLATGLSSGVKQIPVLTDDEETDAVSVLSAPVDVSMTVDNPATYYGRGLAPMFFSIALWVMGISAFFLVRPITGRILASRGSNLRVGVTAWLTLGALSVVASWIMLAVAWIGLGLDPIHPWLTILLVTLVALAFSAVAHLMRTSFGLVATAVMLVLLILQLSSAGGTYPPELLPPLFATIGHFMPMTYTIDAFRIAISGGLMTKFVRDIALLAVLFGSSIGLLMLVVHRRRRFSMTDLHPPFD